MQAQQFQPLTKLKVIQPGFFLIFSEISPIISDLFTQASLIHCILESIHPIPFFQSQTAENLFKVKLLPLFKRVELDFPGDSRFLTPDVENEPDSLLPRCFGRNRSAIDINKENARRIRPPQPLPQTLKHRRQLKKDKRFKALRVLIGIYRLQEENWSPGAQDVSSSRLRSAMWYDRNNQRI
jgi:hypothetical protein